MTRCQWSNDSLPRPRARVRAEFRLVMWCSAASSGCSDSTEPPEARAAQALSAGVTGRPCDFVTSPWPARRATTVTTFTTAPGPPTPISARPRRFGRPAQHPETRTPSAASASADSDGLDPAPHNNNLFTQPPRGDQAGSAHTAKGAGPQRHDSEPESEPLWLAASGPGSGCPSH